MADDKIVTIMSMISEVSEKIGRVDERCNSMEQELSKIHQEDKRTNTLLEEHIRNTKTNTERLTLEIEARKASQEKAKLERQLTDTRLQQLERYPMFLSTMKEIAVWISKIGGAAVLIAGAITKILGMW